MGVDKISVPLRAGSRFLTALGIEGEERQKRKQRPDAEGAKERREGRGEDWLIAERDCDVSYLFMLSEWNAACTHDDPTVVVPWSDPESGARFLDLRVEPYDIAEIAEAELHPALGRALRSLNATRSPVMTVKCDAWAMSSPADDAKLELLRMELMLHEDDAAHGFSSYIDVLWRERSVFASAHHQQDRLDRIARRVKKLAHPEAVLDCTLRPAFLDLNTPLEGFAVSLYVTAIGPEPEVAKRRWEMALEDVVAVLRSKEFETARGAATIDAVAVQP